MMRILMIALVLFTTLLNINDSGNPCPECVNGCVVTGGSCPAYIEYVTDKFGNSHAVGGSCKPSYYCRGAEKVNDSQN